MSEVFLVEAIIPYTGHSHHYVVVAKDIRDAEDFVKNRYGQNPLGDMSDCIILKSKTIDRSKKGIVEMEEE